MESDCSKSWCWRSLTPRYDLHVPACGRTVHGARLVCANDVSVWVVGCRGMSGEVSHASLVRIGGWRVVLISFYGRVCCAGTNSDFRYNFAVLGVVVCVHAFWGGGVEELVPETILKFCAEPHLPFASCDVCSRLPGSARRQWRRNLVPRDKHFPADHGGRGRSQTLSVCWGAGRWPTGARDPYGCVSHLHMSIWPATFRCVCVVVYTLLFALCRCGGALGVFLAQVTCVQGLNLAHLLRVWAGASRRPRTGIGYQYSRRSPRRTAVLGQHRLLQQLVEQQVQLQQLRHQQPQYPPQQQ